MEIAKTILEQLGGGKFVAMTGAKSFIGHADALSFRLPGGGGFAKNGINYVKITRNGLDLYNVEFQRIRGGKATLVSWIVNVYSDDLHNVFEHHTGLRTSL